MKRMGLLALGAILVFLIAAAPAAAQIPDEFTNLTVFPKDIGKRELLDAMRDFSLALGAGCDHCHAAKIDGSQGLDFARDELEPKKIARGMLKMVSELNQKLPGVTGRPSPLKVRCLTCHHGIVRPESLAQALMGVAEKQGVDGIASRYKELRKDYYGSGSYDFGPGALNEVAQRLAEERKDLDGAIVVTQLNIENNPAAASAHLMLGQFFAAKGDKDAAVASIQRAIELEPDNRRAKQALERLRSPE